MLSLAGAAKSLKHTFVATEHVFVATKVCLSFCRDKIMFVVANICCDKILFVATNICRDKRFAATNSTKVLSHDKTFAATKMVLVTALANDNNMALLPRILPF